MKPHTITREWVMEAITEIHEHVTTVNEETTSKVVSILLHAIDDECYWQGTGSDVRVSVATLNYLVDEWIIINEPIEFSMKIRSAREIDTIVSLTQVGHDLAKALNHDTVIMEKCLREWRKGTDHQRALAITFRELMYGKKEA